MKLCIHIWLLLILVPFIGCSSRSASTAPDGAIEPAEVSYARDIQPIWESYCTRCHFRPVPALELSEARSWQDLTTGISNWPGCGAFVVPGQPEQSLLWFKLTGSSSVGHEANGACRRSMPADWDGQGDTRLADIDPEAVDLVRQWILAGAPNN